MLFICSISLSSRLTLGCEYVLYVKEGRNHTDNRGTISIEDSGTGAFGSKIEVYCTNRHNTLVLYTILCAPSWYSTTPI